MCGFNWLDVVGMGRHTFCFICAVLFLHVFKALLKRNVFRIVNTFVAFCLVIAFRHPRLSVCL